MKSVHRAKCANPTVTRVNLVITVSFLYFADLDGRHQTHSTMVDQSSGCDSSDVELCS